jgi:hypothetical protein
MKKQQKNSCGKFFCAVRAEVLEAGQPVNMQETEKTWCLL